jgi:capsular polysaccharide export protein
MFKIIKKIQQATRAIDNIWNNIIKPEKPIDVGNSIRFHNYIAYLQLIHELKKKNVSNIKIDQTKTICCNLSKNDIQNFQSLLYVAFDSIESIEDRKKSQYDYFFIWGAKFFKIEKTIELALKKSNCALFFIEDGFFRSVCGGLKKNIDQKYSQSISLIFDDMCPHYDGNNTSRLESILSDNNEEYKLKSKELLFLKNFILKNNLTKYNDQPNYISPKLGFHKNKVLIVMQTSGDASVTLTGGDKIDFEIIIEDAITENPDADIILKVHPDTIIKKQKGYAERYINDPRIILIDFECSIPSLLNYCSKVYVYSSQVGFEALLRNKEVIVYGKPFYSGYGLTTDRNFVKRTTCQLSIDKMFYDIMYKYTLWFSHDGQIISAKEALNNLNNLINNFKTKKYKKVLILKLDGLGDWIIFEKYLKQIKKSKKFENSKFYLIGDSGFKDYAITDSFFNKTYWINYRKTISKLNNKFQKKIIINLLIKCFLLRHPTLSKIQFDAVIFSCWNNEVNFWGNNIISKLHYTDGFCRNAFGKNQNHVDNLKLYNHIIPITGDHLRYHRSEMEHAFLENITETKLEQKIIINRQYIKQVFIFCGAFASKRRWSSNHYIHIAKDIANHFKIKCYVFGLDKSFSKHVKNDEYITYNFGKVNMQDIVTTLQKSELYIGGDTGFFHLAYHKSKECIVISNGNSLRTFCQVPRIKEIEYVFPSTVDKYLSDRKKYKKEIFDITRSSNLDINEISYEKVWQKVSSKIIKNHEFYSDTNNNKTEK